MSTDRRDGPTDRPPTGNLMTYLERPAVREMPRKNACKYAWKEIAEVTCGIEECRLQATR